MKVRETAPMGPAAPASRVTRVTAAEAVDGAGPPASISAVQNSASLLGIPPEEMTPKVRQAILSLLREVEALREELDTANRRLADMEKLADLDPLAPIANRRAFVRDITRLMSYSQRYDVPASLLYFDVNDLKKINDHYGHAAGDAVLIHVANTILANVRQSDSVGRLGGDEFAVLLAQADERLALEKGGQLAKIIAESPPLFQGAEIPVRVAFGAYTFRPGEQPAEVLARADRRMYAHKRDLKAQDGRG
ncbi:MAG: GGDEF domain-containing protein [Pseudomonadota bacterium]